MTDSEPGALTVTAVRSNESWNWHRYMDRIHYCPLASHVISQQHARSLPYILAYKSQNLPQNLDLKVGGATYTQVIK